VGQNSWLKCPLGFLVVIYCKAVYIALFFVLLEHPFASVFNVGCCIRELSKKTTKTFVGEPNLYNNLMPIKKMCYSNSKRHSLHFSVSLDPPLALGDASVMKWSTV